MCGVHIQIVGEGISFSPSYEAVIKAEFPFVAVSRVGGFNEIKSHAAPRQLLVIEEQAFWADPDAVIGELDRHPDCQVVLAYGDAEIADRFYSLTRHRKDSARISLLPMSVQLDCWVAIFRLLVLGQGYLPSNVVSGRASNSDAERKAPKNPLTSREREILELASKGKQNKAIAFDLGVSEHTVKLHMHHIIKKLGVRNRTEAVGEYLQGFPKLLAG